MTRTLIILNPHAAGGLAGQLWQEIEPILWETLGELLIAVTQKPDEVAQHLDKAYSMGLTRVISIGGDGTNHALINALAAANERHPNGEPIVYGNLPIGTGRDWARGLGVPFGSIRAAADWIANAQPQPTDVGLLTFDDQREYFLNIASAGLGGEVSRRVERVRARRPWTFARATLTTIATHRPQPMQVTLDGRDWYEGDAYVVAVANGTTFGHGMKIAPNAQVRDGLFDVVLVKGIARARVLAAFGRVYSGTHLTHPGVLSTQARQVAIRSPHGLIEMELDGEYAAGRSLTFTVRPGLVKILS
jgi:YegS/Rv2252/BmrU family lipid kinase